MLQSAGSFQLVRNDFLLHNKAVGWEVGVICNVLSLVVEGYYIYRNSNGERDYILRCKNFSISGHTHMKLKVIDVCALELILKNSRLL